MYAVDRRSDEPCAVVTYPSYDSGIHESDSEGAKEVFRGRGDGLQVPISGSTLASVNRVKSMFTLDSLNSSMSDSSCSSIESSTTSDVLHGRCRTFESIEPRSTFVSEMRRCIGNSPHCPDFANSSAIRKAMEPHMRRARLMREESRRMSSHLHDVAPSIASSMGVPYTALRRESPFLFDEHTYPLHAILADTLRLESLTQAHCMDEKELLLPLLDKELRHEFHSAYDMFVTSFCIPLLHSMVLSKRVLQHSGSDRITYRYQAFPTIQISRPGGSAMQSPRCDSILGHSIGCLTFVIPLTPCEGTNCTYIESHPGREDWHPLSAKSVGLGYLVDGVRCMHFDLENTTQASRVSLTFRIMIYRDGDDAAGLCPTSQLSDAFSKSDFYDEAVIDLRVRSESVVKRNGDRLLDPCPQVGYPFA